MCSLRSAGKRTPTNCKNPKKCRYYRLYNVFIHFHLRTRCKQKTRQMHLKPSSTCFEWPRGREIRFMDAGPGNWILVLLNLVHRQKYTYIHTHLKNERKLNITKTMTNKIKQLIWNIMGTLSVILFSNSGTKLVRSLTIVVRNLTTLVRNTIPK